MRKALLLSKLYINSMYGVGAFWESLKHKPSDALKKLGILLAVLLSMSGMIVIFVQYNAAIYNVLAPYGKQQLVLVNSVITAFFAVLIFGITGVVATYYIGQEGNLLLSLPLRPWELLWGKFAASYFYEFIICFFVMASGFMVYGIKSGEGVIFYIACMLNTMLVPVIPLAACYFIAIILMRMGRFLKSKDTVMMLSGAFGIIIVVVMQLMIKSYESLVTKPGNYGMAMQSMNMFSNIGKLYYPSIWAVKSMTEPMTVGGVISLILFALVSILALTALLKIMSGTYAHTLGDTGTAAVSMKPGINSFKDRLKANKGIRSYLFREIKLMNREPVYFLNGPLVVILVPVILGIVCFIQGDELRMLKDYALRLDDKNSIMLQGISLFSAFMGISANVTSTGISREGKAFVFLKSLPIDIGSYLNAKFIHGEIFCVAASVIPIIIGKVMFSISLLSMILIPFEVVILTSPILLMGLYLELRWPKLDWDNPQKAVKQNVNSVITIFSGMLYLVAAAAAVFLTVNLFLVRLLVLTILPLAVTVFLYSYVMKYGKKVFFDIEV